MKNLFILFVIFLVSGCATNQLGFADYTSDEDLSLLRTARIDEEITEVEGIEQCTNCKEFSKIVWHAAILDGLLYQAFLTIPVDNWVEFVKQNIKPTGKPTRQVKIEINRIFLKTWHSPQYYACKVELTVITGGERRNGSAFVKIKGVGQEWNRERGFKFNKSALESVRLALVSAYLNASKNTK